MKSESEIQRAHDLLTSVIASGVMDPDHKDATIVAASVLCWTLSHEHNFAFGEFLQKLEAILRRHGIELVDSGELHYPDDETVH